MPSTFSVIEGVLDLLERAVDIRHRHPAELSELAWMPLHQLGAVVVAAADLGASLRRVVVEQIAVLRHRQDRHADVELVHLRERQLRRPRPCAGGLAGRHEVMMDVDGSARHIQPGRRRLTEDVGVGKQGDGAARGERLQERPSIGHRRLRSSAVTMIYGRAIHLAALAHHVEELISCPCRRRTDTRRLSCATEAFEVRLQRHHQRVILQHHFGASLLHFVPEVIDRLDVPSPGPSSEIGPGVRRAGAIHDRWLVGCLERLYVARMEGPALVTRVPLTRWTEATKRCAIMCARSSARTTPDATAILDRWRQHDADRTETRPGDRRPCSRTGSNARPSPAMHLPGALPDADERVPHASMFRAAQLALPAPLRRSPTCTKPLVPV